MSREKTSFAKQMVLYWTSWPKYSIFAGLLTCFLMGFFKYSPVQSM